MAELFISYAKPNREQALTLADELRVKGFSVWIDQGGIGGAKNWTAEIVEAINACSTLVLLLSPESIASRNVAKEVQLASEKGRNILPVVIEKVTLPSHFEYPLVGIQRVYFHDRPAILHALELLKGVPDTGRDAPPARLYDADDSSIRVAVLPFDDLSPKHDNQWFADGMMDELISTLGHLENMKVPSRSDVLHYRERHAKTRVIAGELGVRYIIEGAVRKAGKKIRINASLIDARQTEQLWANQFDGSFEDVFAFQESVSKSIADALSLKLAPKEIEQMETRPTENAEAYELYLKGRHEQYYFTKESYLRALELYEQAAKLDPTYERAYIGAASACCVYFKEYSRNRKWLTKAEGFVKKVEEIYGETSRSLSMRGMIDWLEGNIPSAIRCLTVSSKMDPKNLTSFSILGTIYLNQLDYLSAIESFQCVVEITENAKDYFNLVVALKAADEVEKLKRVSEQAITALDRYLLREPLDDNARVSRALILIWNGHDSEAEIAANALLQNAGLNGNTLYNLGIVFDHLGKPDIRINLFRLSIERGYREIELAKTQNLHTKVPEHELEFAALVSELERIVAEEKLASDD